MRQALYLFCTLVFLFGLVACSTDAPEAPAGPGGPYIPPAGPNPGGPAPPLGASIDLSATIGNAPLAVNLWANVVGGLWPYYYRWDVNGDGWWDYGGEDVSVVAVHYASAGLYNILLEVEDASGQFYHATAQVHVFPSGPVPVPMATPESGNAPLNVQLDGGQSYDADGYVVLYEWDHQSDGVWDHESETNPIFNITYDQQGVYTATLRVTDDDGLKAEASIQITVF